MTEFEAKAVVIKVNKMFKDRHFSICDVDKLMSVTGAIRTGDYKALSLLHCMDFSDMDAETKEFVFRATLENITNVDDFPAVKLVVPSDEISNQLSIEQKEKPLLKRLFGKSI